MTELDKMMECFIVTGQVDDNFGLIDPEGENNELDDTYVEGLVDDDDEYDDSDLD